MKTYIYPQNLKASAGMWLWSLRDFAVICIAALISSILIAAAHLVLPMAATACYAFMTIRSDDVTITDFIRWACRYFITAQQYYEWK